MPELRTHPAHHQRPRRPLHLSRRLTPPPLRPAPPDMRWMLYAGVVLAGAMVLLALPYLVTFVLRWVSAGS